MKRRAQLLLLALTLLALAAPTFAQATFGLDEVGVEFEDKEGNPVRDAGSHPFAMATTVDVNTAVVEDANEIPDGMLKDLVVDLPPGLAGIPKVVPACLAKGFAELDDGRPLCPNEAVVGIASVKAAFFPFAPADEEFLHVPVYRLEAPPGVAMKLGFYVLTVPVTVDATVNPDPPYNVQARATNIAQTALFYASVFTLWGDPASATHDPLRGSCLSDETSGLGEFKSTGKCPVSQEEHKSFLTLPRSCTGPLSVNFFARAWNTGGIDQKTTLIAPGIEDCQALEFEPEVSASPSTNRADSPSGLDFALQIEDEELTSTEPGARAQSDVKGAVVTLPKGVTINPSQAEGLKSCSEEDLARESLTSQFGEGCPAGSKIGTVEVESQLLEGEVLKGSLFVAEPYTNRFGSLLAIYQVIRSQKFGIVVKLAGQVELDPVAGQITTTFEDLPQLPFSDFRLHFRGGDRSPLVTPDRCGSYEVQVVFTPWADPGDPFTATAPFTVSEGIGGGACPVSTPFNPALPQAGTLNSTAGAFSPLYMRLTRADGQQEFTRFDGVLPKGLVGKIAGVERCSDGALAAAEVRPGKEELANPSCPQGSRIGSVEAGAGVGPSLTFVPGTIYLAGPYDGHPLSVAVVTPAVAGPFDLGTVVVRTGLDLDENTAEATVDGSAGRIPRILEGVPLELRDLRVFLDRENFTLNATSCETGEIRATLLGSDGTSSLLTRPYQAANCRALGFKPKLKIALKGGTRRTQHPELRSVLTPRPGDANIGKAAVTLPPTMFIDNAHISNPCTRVQFNEDACPKGSVLGQARAITPLLDEPLEGPVIFRSNGGERELPDIVADLRGQFHIVVVGWVDSVKGRTRTRFQAVPDAPVSKFVLNLNGGKQGLLQNSANLCKKKRYVSLKLAGQNGKRYDSNPVVATSCKKQGGKKRGR